MAPTSCPCCGDAMPSANVVCWTCYRITDRLSPGVHLDPNGTPDQGYAVTINEAQIAQWDQARNERVREGELAKLVVERELEADPFHLG